MNEIVSTRSPWNLSRNDLQSKTYVLKVYVLDKNYFKSILSQYEIGIDYLLFLFVESHSQYIFNTNAFSGFSKRLKAKKSTWKILQNWSILKFSNFTVCLSLTWIFHHNDRTSPSVVFWNIILLKTSNENIPMKKS